MFKIEYTYDGKHYDNLMDAVVFAAIGQIKEHFEKSIAPFNEEIIKNKGRVIVNIPKNLGDPNIQFKNLPQGLIDRIVKAVFG